MGVLQAAEAFITNKPKKSKQVADIINHIMSKNPSFVKMEEGNKEDNAKNVDYWLYWDEKKFGIYAKENSLAGKKYNVNTIKSIKHGKQQVCKHR